MTFQYPYLLALLNLLPAYGALWLWRKMRISPLALGLRLFTLTFLVLALANPTFGTEAPLAQPLIILVDQSESLTASGQATLRAQADQIVTTLAASNRTQPIKVLWFGAEAVAPQTGSLDSSATNLAAALHTAQHLLPTGGRVLLLSDGLQTAGDALLAAQQVAASGLTVDVQPFSSVQTTEVRISGLEVPLTLHVGEEYTIQINVEASGPFPAEAPATLRLWEQPSALTTAEKLLAEEEVKLKPGNNRFSFPHRAEATGVTRLRAEIKADPDTFPRNNRAAATVLVGPTPNLLLVEGREGNGKLLQEALQKEGINGTIITPEALPSRLSDLRRYEGMVLIDVPARSFSLDQMTSIQEFVRSEGRGLVVTGGINSFGLGMYKNTPLEQVLPVKMDAPSRGKRPAIALLLLMDRSASMTLAIGVSKLDMAKEAAILSTEALRREDRIGVLAFDTKQEWIVNFQNVGQGAALKQVQDSIAILTPGGGTDIYGALNVGLAQLVNQKVTVRHAVLLTDGRSFTNDQDAYQRLIEAARAQKITLSTIAIGQDSDTELLDKLAKWGNGRYYFTSKPEDIPKLTLQESEIARADPSVETTFQADLALPHPLLRDFAPAKLPQVEGYVATTLKEGADLVLRSPEKDPVLATWQYGLGRAVAWTPSLTEPWAKRWPLWEDYGRFWAQVVRYTLPEPDSGPLQVQFRPQPGGVKLIAEATQPGGQPLDLADAQARVTLPDSKQYDTSLWQIAPGRYAQDLLLPNEGAYTFLVALERKGQLQRTEVGYVKAVPAEYTPPSNLPKGRDLLQQIASLTGGKVLGAEEIPPLATPTREQTPSTTWPLALWFLLVALLCWVLEIAERRTGFSSRFWQKETDDSRT